MVCVANKMCITTTATMLYSTPGRKKQILSYVERPKSMQVARHTFSSRRSLQK